MTAPDPFWGAMNRLGGLKDVEAVWRRHFGAAYAQAKLYLGMESEPAYYYPCRASCGMSCHMRVRRGRKGFFAFCAEDPPQTDSIDLSDEDVVMYRLNVESLGRDIGQALAVQTHDKPEVLDRNAWEIGTVTLPPGRKLSVCFALRLGLRDYTDIAKTLLVRGQSEHILLVPGGCDGETRRLIEDKGGQVFSLSDIAQGVPGKAPQIRSLSSVLSVVAAPLEPRYRFEKKGEVWQVRWDGGETVQFKDTLGFCYYRILIDNPYISYSAYELKVLADRATDAPKPGMAIEVADEEARRALCRKMEDLHFRLAEAEKNQDENAADLKAQIEALREHTRSIYNLHHGVRDEANELDRARKSVFAAMDVVRQRLAANGLTDLAAYMDAFMPTGTFMKYHPVHQIPWNV